MALVRALRSLGARAGLTAAPQSLLLTGPAQSLLPAAAAAIGQVRHMSGSKLFVGGLAWEMDEVTLREAFSSFGLVEEAKVVTDRVTGRSRGFGFVQFQSPEDAENALAGMDGKFLGGRTIRVDYATQREPGAPRTGGRRFGGPGGGRYNQGGGGGGYNQGGYNQGGGGGYNQGGGGGYSQSGGYAQESAAGGFNDQASPSGGFAYGSQEGTGHEQSPETPSGESRTEGTTAASSSTY